MMKQMNAAFAGRCNNCPTRIKENDLILWGRGLGAQHVVCPNFTMEPVPVAPKVEGIATVIDFLNRAKTHGLKAPKARFLAPDGKSEMKLSMATERSKYPGSVQVKIGYDQWIGRIEADGTITRGISNFTGLLGTLSTIMENPALAAKNYGALCGRCSFCNLPLTDDGSVEVGYGPICAKHYNLPHTPKGVKHLTATVPVGIPTFVPEPVKPAAGARFLQIEEAVA